MRRLFTLVVVLFAVLALAPAASADTTAGPRPIRGSYEAIGFDAFSSQCDERTCTDTYIYAEESTDSSGETFEYVCVDQWTYNLRTGRGTGSSGCTDTTNLTVADDLSSATLAPTDIEVCGSQGRGCETVTVSADLEATGGRGSYRSRGTFREGNCTFTYTDSGVQRSAAGTITYDGEVMDAQGQIRTYESTFTERCT